MAKESNSDKTTPERTLNDIVFCGFNSQVIALDRYTGDIVWTWKCPKGRASYVSLLLDGDRLIVSVQGYTYCIDPLFGQVVWNNPLTGYGMGIPCIASIRGNTATGGASAAKAAQQAAAAAAASPAVT